MFQGANSGTLRRVGTWCVVSGGFSAAIGLVLSLATNRTPGLAFAGALATAGMACRVGAHVTDSWRTRLSIPGKAVVAAECALAAAGAAIGFGMLHRPITRGADLLEAAALVGVGYMGWKNKDGLS